MEPPKATKPYSHRMTQAGSATRWLLVATGGEHKVSISINDGGGEPSLMLPRNLQRHVGCIVVWIRVSAPKNLDPPLQYID